MKQGLLSLEDARQRLLAGARKPAGFETVPTVKADGRVLAQALYSIAEPVAHA